MAVRFNPNVSAYLNTDPLSRVDSLDQLETSPLYAFSWNGRTETVYHTDSFDYVVPVVEDDSPVSVEIQVKSRSRRRCSVQPGRKFSPAGRRASSALPPSPKS